jgi:hypothetical protein
MEAGTRVKLTAKAANTRRKGYRRKTSTDWTARRGVIRHIGREGRVSVLWEGNKTVDQLQLVEVEGCDE